MITNMAKNQFVIEVENGKFFQSYETTISFKPSDGSTPTVTKAGDCSATALKYLKQFLGLQSYSKKEIEQKIASGSIILDNSLVVRVV